MIDSRIAQAFLAGHRIAVVGASDEPKNFGGVILRALADHGYDPVPVNPGRSTVAGRTSYASLTAVPGAVDGAVVVVPAGAALEVIRDANTAGVDKVWLFKGLGSAGAVSDEVVDLCRQYGMTVVAGACPLMFLDPVNGFHRFHRRVRRMNHSLSEVESR